MIDFHMDGFDYKCECVMKWMIIMMMIMCNEMDDVNVKWMIIVMMQMINEKQTNTVTM